MHQSVYELVHSEDREELQRQLMWNSFLPAESATLPLHDALSPQHSHLLERSFTVRFRCLLDNTSGFLVRTHVIITIRIRFSVFLNKKLQRPLSMHPAYPYLCFFLRFMHKILWNVYEKLHFIYSGNVRNAINT